MDIFKSVMDIILYLKKRHILQYLKKRHIYILYNMSAVCMYVCMYVSAKLCNFVTGERFNIFA